MEIPIWLQWVGLIVTLLCGLGSLHALYGKWRSYRQRPRDIEFRELTPAAAAANHVLAIRPMPSTPHSRAATSHHPATPQATATLPNTLSSDARPAPSSDDSPCLIISDRVPQGSTTAVAFPTPSSQAVSGSSSAGPLPHTFTLAVRTRALSVPSRPLPALLHRNRRQGAASEPPAVQEEEDGEEEDWVSCFDQPQN
ncbi:hypothetical protein MMC27_006980 [Xylographa pallens]|nr:hypothetical protein [Xylographa pallens]